MKTLIDAHMLGEQEGGNETYVAGLLHGFKLLTLPDDMRLSAVYNASYSPIPYVNKQLNSINLKQGSNWRRLFVDIPQLCRCAKVDILHATYNASPWLSCSLVLSVHDVIFRRYPHYFSARVRLLLSTLLPLSMYRAAVILTLSEASKSDIITYYPFTRNTIVVIPLAADHITIETPDPSVVNRYTDRSDFILAVGTIQPRKNIARVIQAYISLRRNSSLSAKLLIVGRSAWQHSAIQQIALSSPYSQDIVFTGYLPDATVAALYQTCRVFIYPSLYEGFGLPVLEAMTCGAPVITSNCSALPEVAGDAALRVDPFSIDHICLALEQVLKNPALREDLQRRGIQQATRFSWKQTALATLDAYKWALQTRNKT